MSMRQKLVLGLLILVDSFIVVGVPLLALLIRFEGAIDHYYINGLLALLPMVLFVRLASFYGFGLYHRLWRYASVNELLGIVGAVTLSSVIIKICATLLHSDLPNSIHLLSWFFTITFIGMSRLCIRVINGFRRRIPGNYSRVLIIGAGDAGAMIAREVKHRYYHNKKIIGFVDDDSYKHKKMIYGVKVIGNRQDIRAIVVDKQIDEIIIAMPSIGGTTVREIVGECKETGCSVKILPGMYELIDGKVTVQQLRDIDLEDLLRREPIQLDFYEIAAYIKGKSVMVTGAGGSIGSELCRQIAKLTPRKLILLGKGENSIYEIHRELTMKFPKLKIAPVIADIRDCERINGIFTKYQPQAVFHAAAHKHVPLMEMQPEEAVRNNVFGTKTIAEAADRNGTDVFVMVSTDKAVNPTSIMGATKRVAELVIQNISKVSSTKFVVVRFGNVLGSRGSVIPLFKKQIAAGGPITITHPDMKRYFMTIPEATQLVLQAGAMAKGGEVFVLDMGKPVKIVDLAQDLIELSGLVVHSDIKIEYTGMRPGEKLFEELLTVEEGTNATKHEKIFVANIKAMDEEQLQKGLVALRRAMYEGDVISVMSKILPSYMPDKVTNGRVVNKQDPRSEVQLQKRMEEYPTMA
jgi:FlaA1/EpsC-like NDP-sugar epimerase